MLCKFSCPLTLGLCHSNQLGYTFIYLFIWGFYIAFNTVMVISRRVDGRAAESNTYTVGQGSIL